MTQTGKDEERITGPDPFIFPLKVDESLVSRDERNEYHGITVDRARKVLDALNVRLVTRVEVEPIHAPSHAQAEIVP